MLKYKIFIKKIKKVENKIKRLDKILSKLFPKYSRSLIKKNILNGLVKLNNNIITIPKKKIIIGDIIKIKFLLKKKKNKKQNIKLNIKYEDNDILIINKQKNLIIHPGSGCKKGTLLNSLLNYNNLFFNIPRAGIVHRLDKNTTGLMIIAKNLKSYYSLIELFKKKNIIKKYIAIVNGNINYGGMIYKSIIRHPIKKTCMTISKKKKEGKKAVTFFKIIKNFKEYTKIKLILKTGRTHQIRVHMLYINHPIIGDNLYKKNIFLKNKYLKKINKIILKLKRPALHSKSLYINHPINLIKMKWVSKLPKDILKLFKFFKKNKK